MIFGRVLCIAASSLLLSCSPHTETDAGPDAPSIVGNIDHIGLATIVDGDTLDIGDNRYRFDGMDTPERGSYCGDINVYDEAALVLAGLVDGLNVKCEPTGKKNGNRLIASCFALVPGVARISLSESLVAQGWARDWPKYSRGRFAALEQEARESGAGIWGLDCPDDLWGDRDYN